jgi:hypothetical protein
MAAAIPFPPSFPFGVPKQADPRPGTVQARLTSLDTGHSLLFVVEPTEHDRVFSAEWESAGVAQASPQFLEYRQSNPQERTYRAVFDGYGRPGGVANSVEAELALLLFFTRRVQGRKRAHVCLYTQGQQRFRCVVTNVAAPIKRLNQGGGALQAYEVTISLKEVPAGAGGPG